MKLGRVVKRILKIGLVLIGLILVAAIAIPYFFKDKIVQIVKDDINKNLNATVDFTDVDLSLLRSFPDFSFQLDELSVIGQNEFEGFPLLSAKRIDFTLDLMSVINSAPIEIESVNMVEPDIRIRVMRDGTANYDIVKAAATTETETPASDAEAFSFLVRLKEYAISKGNFLYDDRQGDVFVEIKNMNHDGSGQFTQDIYDIFTKTKIESLTAKSGGIAYLNRAKGDFDVTVNIDMPNSKYTLKDNEFILNALKLKADGFLQLDGDNINMDFTYSTPQNQFKHFLSLIPSAFTTDFNDVTANGDLAFSGFVKGTFNSITGQLPGFGVKLNVKNGDFKYPDLPLGISGINTRVAINSPSSNLDKMTVDVPEFKMNLGNNPFEAIFNLKTPISDPDIDTKMNGTINLTELAQAFPMEGVKSLNGIITANLEAQTRMSAIDKQDFDAVNMNGQLRIEKMDYKAEGSPDVLISDMQMEFTPRFVKLDRFDAQLGKSDIQAQGTVDNILAYFSPEKTMKGKLTVRSNFFDANEWIPAEEAGAPAPAVNPEASAGAEEEAVFDRFDFTLDGEVGKLLYDVYELRDVSLRGNVTPNKAQLDNFYTKLGQSDFRASGKITNMFNYLFENETIYGDIRLQSKFIDLNEFMVEETTGAPAATTIADEEVLGPILIPEKMDFNINADIDKVRYTNINLTNIKGNMTMKEEQLKLNDCSAKTMGGSFRMDGTYDTQNKETPAFDFKYNVNRFEFGKAFNTLNSLALLAPIGKFIDGKFNTTLELKGNLDQAMMPDLKTLSANGFLQTINGVLNNFKPAQELANKLNVDALKTLKIKDTRNYFALKDGKVEVKDFPYSFEGIDMVVGGFHGLDTEMDYNIKAKVPRKMLEGNKLGDAANKGIKLLEGQAAKLGLNINAGEFINVAFKITGSMTNPKVNLKLLGTADGEGSITDVVNNIKEQVTDSITTIVKENITVAKDSVKAVVDNTKADLKAKADAEIKKLMDTAKKNADKTRNGAKKASEEITKLGYKNADDLVKKAGKNPFKKKAAEIAAKKLRKETDKKAQKAIDEGEKKAQDIMNIAEKNATKIRKGYEDK